VQYYDSVPPPATATRTLVMIILAASEPAIRAVLALV
jgi:hypothetical protein